MKINWNKQWLFSKTKSNWDMIDLPHTWNGTDGQDGATIIIEVHAIIRNP